MEVFKVFGSIFVKNQDANTAIDQTTDKGQQMQSKLSTAFEKVGSTFGKMFDKDGTKKVKKSFDELTETTEDQRTKLDDLKAEYKNMYMQHGKNSSEARKVANEIKKLSKEVKTNETKLDKANASADKYDRTLKDVGATAEKVKTKLSGAFSSIGKGAVALGKTMSVGLMAGATAMGALTAKAVNLAGELEQNMGGSEQVFGEFADSIQGKAKEAFSNMGLSTSEYLATANKMGALFQGAGFSIEESMNLSSEAMQRAGDVASIMGIDTASAMEAVAGMAKGNFTMMDNLGVAMNDTTLNAYALSKGIKKTTQDMTNQEKTALAMEMFLEKTAYATGNYAKENATLAGSLGTAKSALTNFLDGSGDVASLVSAFHNATYVIVDSVEQILPRLVDGLTELVDRVVPMIPPLIERILPSLIEGSVALINALIDALPSTLEMLISSVLPMLLVAVVDLVNYIVEALPSLMEMLCSALPELLPLLITGLVSMIVTLCTNLPMIIQPIIDYLPMIIDAVITALLDNLPLLIEAGGQLLMGLLQGMVSLVGKIPEILSTIYHGIVDGIKILFDINSPSKVMSDIGGHIMQGLIQGIQNLIGSIGTVLNNVKNKVTSVFSNIKTLMENPIKKAKDSIKNIIDAIKGFFSGLKLTLPKIKLPHFKITGSLSLSPPSVPKLTIDWYKKAMDDGMIMNQPTIFGFNGKTNQFMAGGEAGSETVVGTESLMGMIRRNVAQENALMMDSVNNVLNRIFDLLSEYVPELAHTQMVLDTGVMVGELAPAMDTALGAVYRKRKRGV